MKNLQTTARTTGLPIANLLEIAGMLEIAVSEESIDNNMECYLIQVADLIREGEITLEEAIGFVKPTVPVQAASSSSEETHKTGTDSYAPITGEEIALAVQQKGQHQLSRIQEIGNGLLAPLQDYAISAAVELDRQMNRLPDLFLLKLATIDQPEDRLPFVILDQTTLETPMFSGELDRRMITPAKSQKLLGS